MLKTGLNIRKKQSEPAQVPQKRPSAFGEDSDDDGDGHAPAPPIRPPRTTLVPQSSLRKVAVLAEDDVAYDYDGVYDSMKVHEQEAAKTKEQDKRERKPKYMQDLFHMAEVRKRDRLQAEDVKLQREREQEGDMFADKEQFVTVAYRAQQEALLEKRRQEEEAEQALRRQAGGLTAFSAGVLAKDRQKHEAAIEASLHAERRVASTDHARAPDVQTTSEIEMAKKAEAELGHKVVMNDNNEIVDHRQLLSAGLNRSKKSDAVSAHQTIDRQQHIGPASSSKEREQRRAQLERQERAVAAQIEEARQQDMEERFRKEALVQQQAKRTKTDADITSAKARYLARKKAEAEAKATGAP